MSRRHAKGREGAVWILYAADISRERPSETIERTVPLVETLDDEVSGAWSLVERRIEGIDAHFEAVDEEVQGVSERWRLERMATVDRNILRMGTFEILEMDVPPVVTIDACVELAKTYGGESTPGFVNGLLDQLCQDHDIDLRS